MSDSPLIKKLRLQPRQRALVLNPPAGFVDGLHPLPEGVELTTEPEGLYGFVHLFVKDSAELDDLLPTALAAVEYDGVFWISYPKQSSKVQTDLSRDILWKLMLDTGLRPVTQVAVDPVWSALRFRPAGKVGT